MDTQGNLYRLSSEEMRKFEEKNDKRLIALTEEQYQALEPMSLSRRKGHMRNKPCPCGSGAKFKRCCWHTYSG